MRAILLTSTIVACAPSTGGDLADRHERRPTAEHVFMEELTVTQLTNPLGTLFSGDMDGDGQLDLVATSDSGGVSLLRGSGDGELAVEELLSRTQVGDLVRAERGPVDTFWLQNIDVGDYDADGVDDLLVSVRSDVDRVWTTTTVILTSLGRRQQRINPGLRDTIHVAQILPDMDGDGKGEIVAFYDADAEVITSAGATWRLDLTMRPEYPSAGVVHLNDDESPDLVLFSNYGFGITEVLTYVQDGIALTPLEPVRNIYGFSSAFGPSHDGVAHDALMTGRDGVSRVSEEGFTPAYTLPRATELGPTWAFGDFDGDERLDLLLAATDDRPQLLLTPDTAGNLVPKPYTGPNLTTAAVNVDLNGDQLDDLVGQRWSPERSSWELVVWMNTSDAQE